MGDLHDAIICVITQLKEQLKQIGDHLQLISEVALRAKSAQCLQSGQFAIFHNGLRWRWWRQTTPTPAERWVAVRPNAGHLDAIATTRQPRATACIKGHRAGLFFLIRVVRLAIVRETAWIDDVKQLLQDSLRDNCCAIAWGFCEGSE
eukprot:scaffold5052_cov30-Tisochrysis_lutea.AAC.1